MNEEMTEQEGNEIEMQTAEDPKPDKGDGGQETQNNKEPARDAATQELKRIYEDYGYAGCDEPKTMDDFWGIYLRMNMECGEIEQDNMCEAGNDIFKIKANALDAILDMHGIAYDPNSLHDVRKNDKSRWYEAESLFERNVVTRESLRKGDGGAAFKIVKYRRDDPGNRQEKAITSEEAVEWLRMTGVSDDAIFKITGVSARCSGR